MGRSGDRRAGTPVDDGAWRDLTGAGLRVLAGRRLSWRQRRAGLTVLASDIDEDSGTAAVWVVQHPGSPGSAGHMLQFEHSGGWQCLGAGSGSAQELRLAGRPSASSAGPAWMMTALGSCAARSYLDSLTWAAIEAASAEG